MSHKEKLEYISRAKKYTSNLQDYTKYVDVSENYERLENILGLLPAFIENLSKFKRQSYGITLEVETLNKNLLAHIQINQELGASYTKAKEELKKLKEVTEEPPKYSSENLIEFLQNKIPINVLGEIDQSINLFEETVNKEYNRIEREVEFLKYTSQNPEFIEYAEMLERVSAIKDAIDNRPAKYSGIAAAAKTLTTKIVEMRKVNELVLETYDTQLDILELNEESIKMLAASLKTLRANK